MPGLPTALFVSETCTSCGGAVTLECEGAPAYLGYRTHNEYFCPHCRKLNHALTFGAIVSAVAGAPGAGEGRPNRPPPHRALQN